MATGCGCLPGGGFDWSGRYPLVAPSPAVSRKIGHAIAEAIVGSFGVTLHSPYSQSQYCDGSYEDLFQQLVAHGNFRFLRAGLQLRNFPKNRPDTNMRNHQLKYRRDCMFCIPKNK
jgi:hypothetical protein